MSINDEKNTFPSFPNIKLISNSGSKLDSTLTNSVDYACFIFLLATNNEFLEDVVEIRSMLSIKSLYTDIPSIIEMKELLEILAKYKDIRQSLDRESYYLLYKYSLDDNWLLTIQILLLTGIFLDPTPLYASVSSLEYPFKFTYHKDHIKVPIENLDDYYESCGKRMLNRGTISRDIKNYIWGYFVAHYFHHFAIEEKNDFVGFIKKFDTIFDPANIDNSLLSVSTKDYTKSLPDNENLRNYYSRYIQDMGYYLNDRKNTE